MNTKVRGFFTICCLEQSNCLSCIWCNKCILVNIQNLETEIFNTNICDLFWAGNIKMLKLWTVGSNQLQHGIRARNIDFMQSGLNSTTSQIQCCLKNYSNLIQHSKFCKVIAFRRSYKINLPDVFENKGVKFRSCGKDIPKEQWIHSK